MCHTGLIGGIEKCKWMLVIAGMALTFALGFMPECTCVEACAEGECVTGRRDVAGDCRLFVRSTAKEIRSRHIHLRDHKFHPFEHEEFDPCEDMREGVCAVGERKWAALGGKTLAVWEQETMRLGYGAR